VASDGDQAQQHIFSKFLVIDDKGEEEGLKISCAALVKPV
jgi:hypothetical protein